MAVVTKNGTIQVFQPWYYLNSILEQSLLKNLNGQCVEITENEIKCQDIKIPILFKETHYGQDWEKVKVLCIQRPMSETPIQNENDDKIGKTFFYLIIHIYKKSFIYVIENYLDIQ